MTELQAPYLASLHRICVCGLPIQRVRTTTGYSPWWHDDSRVYNVPPCRQPQPRPHWWLGPRPEGPVPVWSNGLGKEDGCTVTDYRLASLLTALRAAHQVLLAHVSMGHVLDHQVDPCDGCYERRLVEHITGLLGSEEQSRSHDADA